ncbi:hypothetical protein HY989_02470 [Candidatus Micrarchaeota archaeon]|nr:hypothetical protein [Candidatus Micrarchaeota archaeon]
MVALQKAVIFATIAWFAIALIGGLIDYFGLLGETEKSLLLIPISVIIIFLAAFEYLKEIHAQYEAEGLELAMVFGGVAIALDLLIFSIFYGEGIGWFLSIGNWLGIAFKFIFPLAAGLYLQHTVTD